MSVCMYPPSEPRCTPIQEEMVFSMSRCSTPARTLEGGMDSSRRAALLHDYFKNNSALTRSIIMEKTTLEQQHRHNWSVLSESRRDQLVNEYFVPSGVREQYEGGFVGGSGWRRGIKSTRSLHLSQSEHDERDGELESTVSCILARQCKVTPKRTTQICKMPVFAFRTSVPSPPSVNYLNGENALCHLQIIEPRCCVIPDALKFLAFAVYRAEGHEIKCNCDGYVFPHQSSARWLFTIGIIGFT